MPETRLYNKLANTAAVTTLVPAARIQPVKNRQGDALPRITFQRISMLPVNHSTGVTTTSECTITIECWGATYSSVWAVADAVRAALSGWSDADGDPQISMSHLQNETDLPEPTDDGRDTLIHRVSQDYLLWYNSA